MPCERKRAAPEGASRVLPGGKTLPQAEFTSAEGEKWGFPWNPGSMGNKRNKNAELSKRALELLDGLDWR